MPRRMRIQYPGALYHAMCRGDRREKIFLDDVDRQDFLKTLAEACQKQGGKCMPTVSCSITLMWFWKHRNRTWSPARLLGEDGIQQDNVSGRQQFEDYMERRRREETDPEALKALRWGWCLGGEGFRRQMLAHLEGNLGEHHSGELHRASADAKAERIIAEELQRHGWAEADLATRRKNDPLKLEIAARLRRETTLPLKAIAQRVKLGTSKAANARLRNHMKQPRGCEKDQPQLGI